MKRGLFNTPIRVTKNIMNTLFHPSYMIVIIRDLFRIKYNRESDIDHLFAAIEWICRSQDASETGGCSEAFTFNKGWTLPYPETTGYIIPTFINYSKIVKDDKYLNRAIIMGDWEIEIQLSSGAVRGGSGINDYPIVFNTGQVILGWTALYRHTQIEKYLNAAVKAADWLVSILDEDGKWSNYTYCETPHAYNSRVAWSLLELYDITGNINYKNAGEKNIRWVMSQEQDNGFFNKMVFKGAEPPLTHTIAYTLRGLLESSFRVDGEFKIQVQESVVRASKAIIEKYEINNWNLNWRNKFLPGRIDETWNSAYQFSCLTGNAQLAIVFQKLFDLKGDRIFFDASNNLVDYLKTLHNIKSKNQGIRGGISGSYPIWGGYYNFSYPNWAAKFFSDSLIWRISKNEFFS